MTEYQCHELVALDRPLATKEMGELRAISTRDEISRFLLRLLEDLVAAHTLVMGDGSENAAERSDAKRAMGGDRDALVRRQCDAAEVRRNLHTVARSSSRTRCRRMCLGMALSKL